MSENYSRPLSVGLDLMSLAPDSGGSSRYTRELIAAMLSVEPRTRIVGFVSSSVPPGLSTEPWAADVEWVRFPVPGRGAPWRLAADMVAIPAMAARRRLDVVHGPVNIAPLVAPGIATIVTLLDLTWMHHPETMGRWPGRAMRVLAPACARAADRVIAISMTARDDMVRTLGLSPGKVDLTPLGVRPQPDESPTPGSELRRRMRLGRGRILLCAAQMRPHKNLGAPIEALPLLPGDVRLVLPGSPTPHQAELRALADLLGVAERVHFPGWVSEADLEGLYAAADCVVLPSLEEGFGLTVLEAMRCGVPVACSSASSLPEVAGDAALLFEPRDRRALARAVARILEDPRLRQQLIERGRARSRRFTWEATATATLASYRRAIAGRARS